MAGLALTTIGYFCLVAVIYLFMILIIFDLIYLTSRITGKLPFMKDSRPNTGLLTIILVTIILIYGSWNAGNPRVINYNIEISKEVKGLTSLKAVMVSDLHLGRTVDNGSLQKMVAKINELKPDLILMPGDIVQDSDIFLEQNMVETLGGLKAKYGVFMSLGNHEYYGGSQKLVVDRLRAGGIQVLQDQYVKVDDSFYIMGREDPAVRRSGRGIRLTLSEITKGMDKDNPVILLNHQPIELEEARQQGVDLQVSGHTHRGQIFPANLITSRIFEEDWGYLKRETLQLIVTCGYGTWGPPLRIGNRPEIVNIDITFTSQT